MLNFIKLTSFPILIWSNLLRISKILTLNQTYIINLEASSLDPGETQATWRLNRLQTTVLANAIKRKFQFGKIRFRSILFVNLISFCTGAVSLNFIQRRLSNVRMAAHWSKICYTAILNSNFCPMHNSFILCYILFRFSLFWFNVISNTMTERQTPFSREN